MKPVRPDLGPRGPAAALLALLLIAAFRSAPAAGAGEPAGGPFDLSFETLVEGVHLAYRPDVPRYPVIGNAVIVETGDGVVLVDGGGAAAVVDQIVERIRALGAGPLRYLIVSHWHSDHTTGLDRYLRAFPAARIISHPWTHERIESRLFTRVAGAATRLTTLRDRAREELATGVDADSGRPLAAAAREYLEQLLRDSPILERQAQLASAAIPHITTDGGMTLPMPGRRIEIHHLGRGNTPGDLVVYLPAERVLIGGDIVTHPVPFGYPSYPSEVVGVIEALLTFDFGYLVLGHGPVQRDGAYARKVLALQRHAVAEVRRLREAGLEEAGIRARLDLSPFDAAITSGDPRLAYFFDRWYREPIVGRVLRELGSAASSASAPAGGG